MVILLLKKVVAAAKEFMVSSKNAYTVIKLSLQGARAAVKKAGGKSNVKKPRILPVASKVGDFLPFLVPVFAGLSAVGALADGAVGVAKAVNDAHAAKKQLEESKRHNQMFTLILK